MSKASLETLPSELLYLILKHLDAHCIILSLRLVCKRFYQVIAAYNQYELNISWKSYYYLKQFLHHVQPENITSLIFADEYSYSNINERFFSLVDISRLTRLRSITLGEVKNSKSLQSLNQLHLSNFIALRIRSCTKYKNNTIAFISKVMTEPTFNQLDLIQSNITITQLSWSSSSNIKHLSTKSCSFTEYNLVLQRLPHLQTFKTLQFIMNQSMSPTSTHHRQLMSLSIGDSSLSMTDFEQVLSLTPSLSTLRLISYRSRNLDSILNGSGWTHLIQTKLSDLKTFHLFFSYNLKHPNDAKDLDLIVDQFRTPFWLQEKKWIVTCDYTLKKHRINFYTTSRNRWNVRPPVSAIKRSTFPLFTIRYNCIWTDLTLHPAADIVYVTNDIIQTSVYKNM